MSNLIVHVGNPVLRAQAQAVTPLEIPSAAFKKMLTNMKRALASEKFGVALAAPQIGVSRRVFAVSGKTLASIAEEPYMPETFPEEFYINPEVIKASKKKRMSNEGCLSVPGKYGTRVERHEKISITYLDRSGQKQSRNASGFLAQIYQHEIDHLNGILYTDNALEVVDVDEDLHPIKQDAPDVDSLRSKRARL